MLEIFISHSSRDANVAEILADMFQSALLISASGIRCTSVDGYRLPVGANTDQELRREVLEAKVLIGLLSTSSFESAYVLFELGARWGSNTFMAPIIAPHVSMSIVKGPLSGFNALSCSNPSQIHQLIDNISTQLGRPSEPASVYQKYIDKLLAVKPSEEHTNIPTSNESRVSANDYGSEDAEKIIKNHCLDQWGDDFAMRAHCEEQEREAVRKMESKNYDDIPRDIVTKIRDAAAKQWPEEFGMRLHEEEQQIAAYRKLNPT